MTDRTERSRSDQPRAARSGADQPLTDQPCADRSRGEHAPTGERGGPGELPDAPELPDLLSLDLAALRTLDHPVLAAVVADLRGRAEQPREMLWGFNNAF